MKTTSRMLAAVAAFASVAVVACGAPPDGGEGTGSTSEAAICTNCGSSSGTGSSGGTGSSSGTLKVTCNPATECCVESGSETVAQMNAALEALGVESGSCPTDLANAGCGAPNAAGTAVVVGGAAPAVASFTWSTANDPSWVGPPATQWWFLIYCPSTSAFPASCLDYTTWYNYPPPEAAYCEKATPKIAGYNTYPLDPAGGCGSCRASASATQD